MQHYDSAYRTFECGAAIGLYRRVKLGSNGKVTQADEGDRDIGILWEESFADGDKRAVKLNGGPGTQKAVAATGTVAKGDEVFTADAGKVSDTQAAGALLRGVAIEDSGADGDFIEILPINGEVAGT